MTMFTKEIVILQLEKSVHTKNFSNLCKLGLVKII